MPSEPAQKQLLPANFKKLYEEHLTAVFNFCLYRVGDRSLAEDLTAE